MTAHHSLIEILYRRRLLESGWAKEVTMAERKTTTPRAVVGRVMARLPPRLAGPLPADSPIDVESLFSDTMRRYPQTMARLAE